MHCPRASIVAVSLFVIVSASACSGAPSPAAVAPTAASAPATATTPAPPAPIKGATAPAAAAPTAASAPTALAPTGSAPTNAAPTAAAPTAALTASDVVVYAADVQPSALTDELAFAGDEASPAGKLIALPNAGDKLNAPPEDDPHVTFSIQVQGGIAYRCWIHMKVGTPKGVSQANRFYVQFSDAFDKAHRPIFTQGSASYMTAQGPEQPGWTWVGCVSSDTEAPESLIYFRTSGAVRVRMQAGMEGVGFDQFLLSPTQFFEQPPSVAVVQK